MGILSEICKDNNLILKQFDDEIAEILKLNPKKTKGVAVDIKGKKYIFLGDSNNRWDKTNTVAHEVAHHLFEHNKMDINEKNNEIVEMEARIFAAVFTALAIWDKYNIKAEKELPQCQKQNVTVKPAATPTTFTRRRRPPVSVSVCLTRRTIET